MVEARMERGGVGAVEFAEGGGEEVFKRPTGDHRVETQDKKRAEDSHDAHVGPELAATESAEGAGGVLARCAAEDELGADGRNSEHEYKEDINDKESAAAVHTGLIREAPDVAEAHCRTDRSGQHAQFGSEKASLVVIIMHGIVNYYGLRLH